MRAASGTSTNHSSGSSGLALEGCLVLLPTVGARCCCQVSGFYGLNAPMSSLFAGMLDAASSPHGLAPSRELRCVPAPQFALIYHSLLLAVCPPLSYASFTAPSTIGRLSSRRPLQNLTSPAASLSLSRWGPRDPRHPQDSSRRLLHHARTLICDKSSLPYDAASACNCFLSERGNLWHDTGHVGKFCMEVLGTLAVCHTLATCHSAV